MAEKVKHVWDPGKNEFVPVQPGIRDRVKKAGKTIKRLYLRIRKLTVLQWSLIFAFVLRFAQLGKGSFWYDEGVSIVFSRLSFSNMIQATAGDVHPPLYYLILWVMARILPMTEFVSRFPSLLLSVAVVYLAWRIADHPEIGLTRPGKLFVLLWVVMSPLQLHYAQETRMYSLLQAEVLLAILFILNRRKSFLSVVLTAILYTHNYGVFYIPTLAIFAFAVHYRFIFNWKTGVMLFVRKWGLYFVVPALLFIPWFVVLLSQMGTVAGGYWIQPVRIPSVIFVLYQMLFAYSMPPTFQGLGVLLTCGVLLYSGWRIFRDRPRNWVGLAILSFAPLVMAVFVSVVWKPILLFRGLIGTAVPLAIFVTKALDGIRINYKRFYAYSLIAVTLIAGVVGHYKYNAKNKGLTTDWVNEIVGTMEHGDAVLALNDNGIIAMATYAPDVPTFKLRGCGAEPFGSLSPATRKALGVTEKRIQDLIPLFAGPRNRMQEYNRIFFISTVSPVSPECEISQADEIISWDNVKLIREMMNDEYAQAGVYLITTKDIY